MKIVNVAIPAIYAEAIDELVKSGEFVSRNEVVRNAVRDFLISRGLLELATLNETEEVAIHG